MNKTADTTNIVPTYSVSFEWRDHYDKTDGIKSISMNVRAENNFKALQGRMGLPCALGIAGTHDVLSYQTGALPQLSHIRPA